MILDVDFVAQTKGCQAQLYVRLKIIMLNSCSQLYLEKRVITKKRFLFEFLVTQSRKLFLPIIFLTIFRGCSTTVANDCDHRTPSHISDQQQPCVGSNQNSRRTFAFLLDYFFGYDSSDSDYYDYYDSDEKPKKNKKKNAQPTPDTTTPSSNTAEETAETSESDTTTTTDQPSSDAATDQPSSDAAMDQPSSDALKATTAGDNTKGVVANDEFVTTSL